MPKFNLSGNAGRFLIAQHAFGRLFDVLPEGSERVLYEQEMRRDVIAGIEKARQDAGLEPLGFAGVNLDARRPRNQCRFFADSFLQAINDQVMKFDLMTDNRAALEARNRLEALLDDPEFAKAIDDSVVRSYSEFMDAYQNQNRVLVNFIGMPLDEIQDLHMAGYGDYAFTFIIAIAIRCETAGLQLLTVISLICRITHM